LEVLAEAYSGRYKSFIKSEALKAKIFEVEKPQSPGFSAQLNTPNVKFCIPPGAPVVETNDPLSSATQDEEGVKVTTASTTSGPCVSDRPYPSAQGNSNVKEQLDKLSLQITQHTNTLRSIMGIEVFGKTDVTSESAKVNPDSKGSDPLDQVRLNSSTIPVHSN